MSSELIVDNVIPDAAKASSVGAKTVKGPAPDSVPVSCALITAASRRDKFADETTCAVIEVSINAGASSFLQDEKIIKKKRLEDRKIEVNFINCCFC